jgi:hypothetical protein
MIEYLRPSLGFFAQKDEKVHFKKEAFLVVLRAILEGWSKL